MRRSKRSYLLVLVTAAVALLLSTWGTGVSLAQEHDMDHGDDHGDPGPTMPEPTTPEPTMPEPTTPEPTTPGPTTPGPGGEECSFLAELFGLCTGTGGGEEEDCNFLAQLFGLCGSEDPGGTPDDCESYSFFEWLTHHECHGHSFYP